MKSELQIILVEKEYHKNFIRSNYELNADYPVFSNELTFDIRKTCNRESNLRHFRELILSKLRGIVSRLITRKRCEGRINKFKVYFKTQERMLKKTAPVKSVQYIFGRRKESCKFEFDLTEDKISFETIPLQIQKYLHLLKPNVKLNYNQFVDDLSLFETTPRCEMDLNKYEESRVSTWFEYFPLNIKKKGVRKGNVEECAFLKWIKKRFCQNEENK